MHFKAGGGLESNGADGALVKHFAVSLLDVRPLPLESLENHVTVKTPERKGSTSQLFSLLIASSPFATARLSSALADLLVPSLASVVQTVLLDVLLYVCRATQSAALRAAVRGLVRVKTFVSAEAALVG